MPFTRRRFLGLIFLPLISNPAQYGGGITYHCDLGEEVFGSWYVSQRGVLLLDWHVRNWQTGEIVVVRRHVPAYDDGTIIYWFNPKAHASVLRVVWFYLFPAWFKEGSCVI